MVLYDSLRVGYSRHQVFRGLAFFSCVSMLLLAPVSLAQNAPAEPPPKPGSPTSPKASPVIEMPKPLTPLTATYPEGAEGDYVVLLKLVVAKDGSVADIEIERGSSPFREAALHAAKAFRFVPAKRDGIPIRAAIRVEVAFVAPRVLPEETAPPNSQSPNSQSRNSHSPNSSIIGVQAPSPLAPIDVSVKGILTPPGATTLSRAEVRLLPGAFGDPFRAIEALPGVTPIASGLPYFFVRGAPPGNVGYFLDGIRVPLLYHLGLGPSVVHPAIVDRVDLYSGGYPAQIGRFAGGVVAGETREPRDEVNAEAVIRVVDAGALVEAPFDNGRGSVLVGGRYSYTGGLFSILQSDIRLDYWDYQARASYDISKSETVTLFAFGARDFLGDKDDDGNERTLVDTTFHRVDLRYDRRLNGQDSIRHAFTFGFDETGFDGGSARDILIGTRSQFRVSPTPFLTLRGGADANVDALKTTLQNTEVGDDIPIVLSSRLDFTGGLWADAQISLSDRFEVSPGIRIDLYGSTGQNGGTDIAIEPRISATLHVTRFLRLVQAHGLASQRPSFFLPGPGFSPDFQEGLQRSFQASAGAEVDLPLDIEGKVIFFKNAFFNMTDAFGTSTFTDLITPESFGGRSLGTAMGMEISARRRMTKRFGGFISYTLSESLRAFDKYRLLAGTNRSHVLNVALGVDIGYGFRAGARVLFYTGYPDIRRGSDGDSVRYETGNDLPSFFRLDGRIEKKWSLGKTRWISAVIEMQNTTLNTETLGIRCEDTCEPVVIGPVSIPSIGLEGGL